MIGQHSLFMTPVVSIQDFQTRIKRALANGDYPHVRTIPLTINGQAGELCGYDPLMHPSFTISYMDDRGNPYWVRNGHDILERWIADGILMMEDFEGYTSGL